MTFKSNLTTAALVGRGHFGEVFMGQDDVHGLVAVKVLKRNPTEAPQIWSQRKGGLLREAQHLKKAKHPNIVEVYHLVEETSDDAILYVMQYCKHGCLVARFKQGPMTLRDVRNVATDVALGLSALHSRGMLHRDIKPSNILRDANGVHKLGDFGLVTDNLMFGYGSAAGYTDHLAPELWHGSATSAKTDIWALGMTLYRLIHGEAWYLDGPKPRDVVQNGGFADTLLWLPHVPKAWRRVIRGMLRDDPKDRYQDALQVLQALATLPTQPVWECSVTPQRVEWNYKNKDRRVVVEWSRKSQRIHTWKAWSEPTGAGRCRALDGSAAAGGPKQTLRKLEAFFDQRRVG